MANTFGARLRHRREQRQIDLASIARRTRISLALLEGLERDDIQRWPGGIFRRSFVRSYAEAIGLDPDAVVREFLELFPDPEEAIDPMASLTSAAEHSEQGPPTRFRCLIDRARDAVPARFARLPLLDRGTPIEVSRPSTSRPAPATPQPDILAAAHLCTELARVTDPADVPSILESAMKLLEAVGLVVWVRDPHGTTLRPAVALGYSDEVLAQLPRVCRETDNPTTTAFRSGETLIVRGTATETGALIVPLMTPRGCAGVLTIELKNGRERNEWVLAIATFFAAQLSSLVGCSPVSRVASA